MINPIANPCDYIMLAGTKSPGLCDITGANSPRKWDERKGYALTGATVVFRGIGLSTFNVAFRLYTEEDFADWENFRPLLAKPPAGTHAKALDIWHPFLEELEIKSVVVEDVSQCVLSDETGEWTYTVKFKEYRKPKLALAKPDGAQAAPVDPVDQYIEQLTKQVQQLAESK